MALLAEGCATSTKSGAAQRTATATATATLESQCRADIYTQIHLLLLPPPLPSAAKTDDARSTLRQLPLARQSQTHLVSPPNIPVQNSNFVGHGHVQSDYVSEIDLLSSRCSEQSRQPLPQTEVLALRAHGPRTRCEILSSTSTASLVL